MKTQCSAVLNSFRVIRYLIIFCVSAAGSPFDELETKSSRMCATSKHFQDFKPTKPDCASQSADFLFEMLESCDWRSTVVIGDSSFIPTMQELLMLKFHSHKYSAMHFDNSSLDTRVTLSKVIIRQLYVDEKLRNFIIILNNPVLILTYFEQAYAAEERGSCALMPHSLRLVVIVLESNLNFIREELKRCVFDNVVIVTIGQNKLDIKNVYSLMWRRKKTRELDSIKSVQSCQPTSKKEICQLFPNVKFGLNERRLLVLAKEWLLHLYKEPVPGSAETKYVGPYMDVVHLLARSLNFTFTVVPKPGAGDLMSWRNFSDQIASSSVDLGATTYPISTSAYYNHSVSFPLLCSNISGVYVNHESRPVSFPKIKNSMIISVILSCSVAISVIIYSVATRAFPGDIPLAAKCTQSQSLANANSSGNEMIGSVSAKEISNTSSFSHSKEVFDRGKGTRADRAKQCVTCSIKNRNKNISSTLTAKEPLLVLKRKGCGGAFIGSYIFQNLFSDLRGVQIYQYFVDITFRFAGTIVNQNSFQIPNVNSARILLWFWNMMVLVMSATFTGTLIANLVGKGETLPFTTFEEMMARGDYQWSCDSESSAMRLMQGAPNGSIMQKLYVGVQRYAKEYPDFNGTMPEIIDRLKGGKFVAIVTGAWQENVRARYLPDLQTIGEILLVTCSGLVLPKASELESAISQKILAMSDTGLLDYAMKKIRNETRAAGRARDEDQVFDFRFIEPILYLCGYGVCFAVMALIVECVCANVNLRKCRTHR